MKATLEKLSALTGIEIPENEFVEAPAIGIPTTAQIVDANTPVVE
jgi:flagellum-specific ATP synthase